MLRKTSSILKLIAVLLVPLLAIGGTAGYFYLSTGSGKDAGVVTVDERKVERETDNASDGKEHTSINVFVNDDDIIKAVDDSGNEVPVYVSEDNGKKTYYAEDSNGNKFVSNGHKEDVPKETVKLEDEKNEEVKQTVENPVTEVGKKPLEVDSPIQEEASNEQVIPTDKETTNDGVIDFSPIVIDPTVPEEHDKNSPAEEVDDIREEEHTVEIIVNDPPASSVIEDGKQDNNESTDDNNVSPVETGIVYEEETETVVPTHDSAPPADKPVIDIIPPVIKAKDITIEFGHEPDFSGISAVDEVDGEVGFNIVGNYDNRKAGAYPLTVIASDSSNNISSVNFVLVVKPHKKYGELSHTIAEIEDTSNKLNEANNHLKDAQANYSQIYLELLDIENKLTSSETKIMQLNESQRSMESALLEAQQKLDSASAAYENAKNQLYDENGVSAEEALNQAYVKLETATESYNQAVENASIQEAAVSDIKTLLSEASSSVELIAQEKENKEKERELLLEIEVELRSRLVQAGAELSTANSAFIEATNAYDKALEKATASEEFNTAKNSLEEAQLMLFNAVQEENNAKNELAAAEDRLAEAEVEKAEQENVVADTYLSLQAATEEYDTAYAEYQNALVNEERAQSDVSAKRTDVYTAQNLLDNAIVERDAAQAAYEAAVKANETLEIRINEAMEAVNAAQDKVDLAQSVIDSGSLGFFK